MRSREPVYYFTRTKEEIDSAYHQNKIVKYRWEPMKRNKRSVYTPFGYSQDGDPDILIPIPFELDVLEHAKKLLELRDTHPAYQKVYSLRKLAKWVTDITGREITHQGLKVRIDDDYERQKIQEEELYKRLQEEIRRKTEYKHSDTPGSYIRRTRNSS